MQQLPKFTQEAHLAQSLKTPLAIEIYEKLSLGQQIKKARLKAGLTQVQLARKLKTSQSVVARMEAGNQNFTIRTLIAISLLLGKRISIKFQ